MSTARKRIVVVGGGIFGVTAAIYAARAGHEVHLFEERDKLLQAASGINQYRLHRGYHYPRSAETAHSAKEAEISFREEYAEAIIDGGRHLYAIAREGSAVNAKQFLAFCDAQGLGYQMVDDANLLNPDAIECVIEGEEARFDPDILRMLAERKLIEHGVQVHLSTPADASLASYDKVIVAAYANTNAALKFFSDTLQEYQFEVCEKPVVTLPPAFDQTDLVVIDGPFMCVDPIGKGGHYVLGNVVRAIHATNIGFNPEVPEHIRPLLNNGIVDAPSFTRFSEFIEHGRQFVPMLKEAKHVGSMFTIRTVLPHLEKTDARPTIVTALNDKCIKIFSGKIGNCVAAAREVVALI